MTDNNAMPDGLPPGLDGDEALAAEYVVGVLDDDARRACTARTEHEPAFAALVATWEARLADLNGEIAEVVPPARVKTALDARLFGAATAKKPGLWASLAFWRGLSAVAAAAAVALALITLLPNQLSPPGDQLIAALAPNDSDLQFVALYDTGTGELNVTRVAGKQPADRDLELWLIVGDDPPASLGLIGTPTVDRPLTAGVTLAVSVEPIGGSPTGAPTGPVVALGAVQKI